MKSKNKIPINEQSSLIYLVKCDDYEVIYVIDETSQKLRNRIWVSTNLTQLTENPQLLWLIMHFKYKFNTKDPTILHHVCISTLSLYVKGVLWSFLDYRMNGWISILTSYFIRWVFKKSSFWIKTICWKGWKNILKY